MIDDGRTISFCLRKFPFVYYRLLGFMNLGFMGVTELYYPFTKESLRLAIH